MCTLTNAMLRERRISFQSGDLFICTEGEEGPIKKLIVDELETYSYQFKSAASVFAKVCVVFFLYV